MGRASGFPLLRRGGSGVVITIPAGEFSRVFASCPPHIPKGCPMKYPDDDMLISPSRRKLITFAGAGAPPRRRLLRKFDRQELVEPAGIAAALDAQEEGLLRRGHGGFHLGHRIGDAGNLVEVHFHDDIAAAQLAE
jgi:hypothetical protein